MSQLDVKLRISADDRSAVAAFDRLSAAIGKVSHYGVGLGIVLPQLTSMVSSVAQASDAFSGLSARIKIASEGLGSASAAQAALFDVAQRTRQPLEAVADGYGKLAGVGRELGLSQKDVIRTTETLAKAMALGGGSAEGQKAALLQLGQALGTGSLRGDEFNSVMEQAPGLAKVLADALGAPVGALRAMAEQGKLTSDVIISALSDSAGKVDAEFGKLPATIGGALTQLSNSFMQTIGLIDQAGGVSAGAAGAIKGMADNMGLTLGAVTALGVGITALRTSTVVATTAMAGLRVAVAAVGGPFGLLASALAAGVTAFAAWKLSGTGAEKAVESQVKESHEEIISRINAQIKAVEERNRKAAEGLPTPRDQRAEQAGAIYAELEGRRQQVINRQGEFADLPEPARLALVASLTMQVARAYTAYTGAAELAADNARAAGDKLVADAGKTAQLDVDIKREWNAKAIELAQQYNQAIEGAAGDPTRVRQLTQERDRRLIEGQRAMNEKLQGLAAAQSAKERALADADAGLTLAQVKAQTDAELAALEDRQIALEALRRAGQISEQQDADETLRIEQDRLTVKARLIGKEIELEGLRQTAPGDAAAAKQQEAKLVALRASLADVTAQIRQAAPRAGAGRSLAADDPNFDPIGDALKKADDAEQVYADRRYERAVQAAEQLRGNAEQLSVSLIADAEQRARAELALEEARLRVQLDIDALGVDKRKEVQATLDAYLAMRNDQLAEQFKPGWRKLIDGWSDTTRLMQDATDTAMGNLLRSAEEAWVRFAQTGKLSVKGMVDGVIAELARLQFRQMAGQARGGLGWLASLFGGKSDASGGVGGADPNNWYSYTQNAKGNAFEGGLRAFAKGGSFTNSVISSPTLFKFAKGAQLGLMGEAGPEGILPLKRMSSGALGVQAQAGEPGGGGVLVQVINNAPGAQATAQESTGPNGQRVIKVLVDQVSNAIAGDISRGGGPVSTAMQRTYGLNRAAGAY